MVAALFKSSVNPSGRNMVVDVLRGFSLILMIIFHFGYDLSLFGYADYDTNSDMEWRVFRAVIVSGFLLAVGMSAYLAYYHHINKQKLMLTVLKLLLVSLAISLSSYVMYPQHWVYFGIIHFVTVAVPLSLLFLRHANFSLLIALVILMGYFTDTINLQKPWEWSVRHLGIPQHTVDLVSILPWFALVLIGIFIMHHQLLPKLKVNKLSQFLARLGQHSLLIYLVHQPLLFAGFYLLRYFKA